MKRIITLCIISILNMQIFASEIENKNSVILTEGTLISDSDAIPTVEEKIVQEEKTVTAAKEETVIIIDKKNKKEINKFIRIKGYLGLPGEVGGYQFGADGAVKLANIDAGIEGMVEGVYRFSERGEIAVGIGAQGIGNINSGGTIGGNNYAFPFYFSGKYNLFKSPFYLKGIIGITINYGTEDLKTFIASQENPALSLTKDSITMENGLYGAIGAGIDLWKVEIEGLYSVNTISSSYTNPNDNAKYTRELENYRIAVGASYAFDWDR